LADDSATSAVVGVGGDGGAGEIAQPRSAGGAAIGGRADRFGRLGFLADHQRGGTGTAREQGFDRLSTVFPFCQLARKSIETILVHDEPSPPAAITQQDDEPDENESLAPMSP
jgi:hypothetical protein